jgi:superfamily II DNA or RNA helicase
MKTRVAGSIEMQWGTIPASVLSEIRRVLTFENSAWFADKRQPRWIEFVTDFPDVMLVPRGAALTVKGLCRVLGHEIEFDDCRSLGVDIDVEHSLPDGGSLFPYQERCLSSLVRRVQGCAVMPCGAGKTATALAGIGAIRKSSLILANTKDLVDQWKDEIKSQLDFDAGVIRGGVFDVREITVSTIQTMNSFGIAQRRDLGNKFGIVIVDEAHHVPAYTYHTVLRDLSGKWRWGLTATPDRPDGLGEAMLAGVGPVLDTVTVDELLEHNRVMLPLVYKVDTGITYYEKGYHKLLQAISEDYGRCLSVVGLVRRLVLAGRRVLVLSLRVSYCELLADVMALSGISAVSLHGKSKKRKEKLSLFRSGGCDVLVATTLADEALDIPLADALVLTQPQKAEGRAVQRLGRVIRAKDGKQTPLVFDLVDRHQTAKRHWYGRRKAYLSAYGDVIQKITFDELHEMDFGGHIGTARIPNADRECAGKC